MLLSAIFRVSDRVALEVQVLVHTSSMTVVINRSSRETFQSPPLSASSYMPRELGKQTCPVVTVSKLVLSCVSTIGSCKRICPGTAGKNPLNFRQLFPSFHFIVPRSIPSIPIHITSIRSRKTGSWLLKGFVYFF